MNTLLRIVAVLELDWLNINENCTNGVVLCVTSATGLSDMVKQRDINRIKKTVAIFISFGSDMSCFLFKAAAKFIIRLGNGSARCQASNPLCIAGRVNRRMSHISTMNICAWDFVVCLEMCVRRFVMRQIESRVIVYMPQQ